LISSPDTRISKAIFDNKPQESILTERVGPNYDLLNSARAKSDSTQTRITNYKLAQAQKVTHAEKERVKRHQEVRNRQLELEEESRVRHMLKDNQASAREKKFERWQREESKERKAEQSKREQSRS
jgi:hypothetical protein